MLKIFKKFGKINNTYTRINLKLNRFFCEEIKDDSNKNTSNANEVKQYQESNVNKGENVNIPMHPKKAFKNLTPQATAYKGPDRQPSKGTKFEQQKTLQNDQLNTLKNKIHSKKTYANVPKSKEFDMFLKEYHKIFASFSFKLYEQSLDKAITSKIQSLSHSINSTQGKNLLFEPKSKSNTNQKETIQETNQTENHQDKSKVLGEGLEAIVKELSACLNRYDINAFNKIFSEINENYINREPELQSLRLQFYTNTNIDMAFVYLQEISDKFTDNFNSLSLISIQSLIERCITLDKTVLLRDVLDILYLNGYNIAELDFSIFNQYIKYYTKDNLYFDEAVTVLEYFSYVTECIKNNVVDHCDQNEKHSELDNFSAKLQTLSSVINPSYIYDKLAQLVLFNNNQISNQNISNEALIRIFNHSVNNIAILSDLNVDVPDNFNLNVVSLSNTLTLYYESPDLLDEIINISFEIPEAQPFLESTLSNIKSNIENIPKGMTSENIEKVYLEMREDNLNKIVVDKKLLEIFAYLFKINENYEYLNDLLLNWSKLCGETETDANADMILADTILDSELHEGTHYYKNLEKILSGIDSKNPIHFSRMAMAYFKDGNSKQAIKHYLVGLDNYVGNLKQQDEELLNLYNQSFDTSTNSANSTKETPINNYSSFFTNPIKESKNVNKEEYKTLAKNVLTYNQSLTAMDEHLSKLYKTLENDPNRDKLFSYITTQFTQTDENLLKNIFEKIDATLEQKRILTDLNVAYNGIRAIMNEAKANTMNKIPFDHLQSEVKKKFQSLKYYWYLDDNYKDYINEIFMNRDDFNFKNTIDVKEIEEEGYLDLHSENVQKISHPNQINSFKFTYADFNRIFEGSDMVLKSQRDEYRLMIKEANNKDKLEMLAELKDFENFIDTFKDFISLKQILLNVRKSNLDLNKIYEGSLMEINNEKLNDKISTYVDLAKQYLNDNKNKYYMIKNKPYVVEKLEYLQKNFNIDLSITKDKSNSNNFEEIIENVFNYNKSLYENLSVVNPARNTNSSPSKFFKYSNFFNYPSYFKKKMDNLVENNSDPNFSQMNLKTNQFLTMFVRSSLYSYNFGLNTKGYNRLRFKNIIQHNIRHLSKHQSSGRLAPSIFSMKYKSKDVRDIISIKQTILENLNSIDSQKKDSINKGYNHQWKMFIDKLNYKLTSTYTKENTETIKIDDKLNIMKSLLNQENAKFSPELAYDMIVFGIDNNFAESIKLGEKACIQFNFSIPSWLENKVNNYILNNSNLYNQKVGEIGNLNLGSLYKNLDSSEVSSAPTPDFDQYTKSFGAKYDYYKEPSILAMDHKKHKGLEDIMDMKILNEKMKNFRGKVHKI